jgi:hypothetical protein
MVLQEEAMRDATNVQIDELIIHILDPEGQGLVLSGITLPLDRSTTLHEYFTRHITETFKSPSIKAAQFRNINPEQPSGACRVMLRGELPLTEGSAQLAQLLYPILERDRRITAGDLAVCFFRAENYPHTRFLAIMKIDPSQVFSHEVKQDARGNHYVTFEPQPKSFTNEKLQKCALVQPLEPRHPEYDMLLLDRQGKGAENDRVARFFSEIFLDAKDTKDAFEYTERLYKGLIRAENRLRDRLTPEENQELTSHVNQAVASRRLNLDRWVEDLPVEQEVRQEIDRALSVQVGAREFPLDRDLYQRLARKARFQGDHSLRLEVPTDAYNQIIVSETLVTDDPDREPYYRIVIETKTWQRLT